MKNNMLIGILAIVLIAGLAYWAMALERSEPVNNEIEAPDTASEMGGTNSGEGGGGVHNLPVEPAAAKARFDLAGKLGISDNDIVVMKVEEKTWSDGCLGLGGPAESCLMALVDGFRVELVASGKTYVYRTDKTGAQVRMEAN